MKRIGIIFNPYSGMVNKIEDIKIFCDALPKNKFQFQIKSINEKETASDIAREMVMDKTDTIIAAGGDGTIRSVAENLFNTKVNLGILPLGSLNHLAKDLRIPLNVQDALNLIISPKLHEIIKIDIGSCNGNIFLNNSGLGIYPRIVELKERFMKYGHHKRFAFLFSLFHTFKNIPKFFMTITIGNETITKKTSFLFVGNNLYGLGGLKTGFRSSFSDGLLSIWISHRTSTSGLIGLLFRAFLGKVEEHRDFVVYESGKVMVETKKKNNKVSFDGEIIQLSSPLIYKIIPECLNVIVPIQ